MFVLCCCLCCFLCVFCCFELFIFCFYWGILGGWGCCLFYCFVVVVGGGGGGGVCVCFELVCFGFRLMDGN